MKHEINHAIPSEPQRTLTWENTFLVYPCFTELSELSILVHLKKSLPTRPLQRLRHGWLWGLLLWALRILIVFLLQRLFEPAATVPGMLPRITRSWTCRKQPNQSSSGRFDTLDIPCWCMTHWTYRSHTPKQDFHVQWHKTAHTYIKYIFFILDSQWLSCSFSTLHGLPV